MGQVGQVYVLCWLRTQNTNSTLFENSQIHMWGIKFPAWTKKISSWTFFHQPQCNLRALPPILKWVSAILEFYSVRRSVIFLRFSCREACALEMKIGTLHAALHSSSRSILNPHRSTQAGVTSPTGWIKCISLGCFYSAPRGIPMQGDICRKKMQRQRTPRVSRRKTSLAERIIFNDTHCEQRPKEQRVNIF